ncbi:hypothetical protein CAEBREN_32465 [Caenorhabditis brenneri]|uniref:Uncharacterized protein n=1 Tax=Caenorhabditis brenneri TaxID=135651 RepID=G0M6Z2_CAEBE|nr:hypothetical protein CAEBREN_32465 [Caenorhabditis brenneri]
METQAEAFMSAVNESVNQY